MKLTSTQARRHRITASMPGFVQHCVITKECPETFLLFLYKTPLFPRLDQVLRICFLSVSLSLSLSPFLPLSLFVETHEYHKRLVYRRTTTRAKCLQGCKEQESRSAEDPPGRTIHTKAVTYFQRKSNKRFADKSMKHSRVE